MNIAPAPFGSIAKLHNGIDYVAAGAGGIVELVGVGDAP